MTMQLSSAHQITFNSIFQHPVARNLKWVDVRSMLISLADSVEKDAEILKLTKHGKTLTLHRPNRSGMDDVAELMKVRHFLDQSNAVEQKALAEEVHALVVIDHRLATVYRTEMKGAVPRLIVPLDPTGNGRHLHYVADDSNGQRRPEPKEFYAAIAQALHTAGKILVFGSGTGASSAMEHLVDFLKTDHPGLHARVVGSLVINGQHISDNQILAKAREFYAGAPAGAAE